MSKKFSTVEIQDDDPKKCDKIWKAWVNTPQKPIFISWDDWDKLSLKEQERRAGNGVNKI